MSFGPYVLGGLVNSFEYTKKVLPYLNEDWFETKPEKIVFEAIRDYINKYNNSPTMEAVAITLSDSPMEEGLYESVIKTLQELEYNPLTETQWLIDKTEEFCKERAIYLALMKSISIVDGDNKKLDKNSIPDILTKALSISFDSSIGHDYFTDAESQYDYYHAENTKIPFKQKILNKITRNGVSGGTLNCLVAPINCGKSTGLIDFAGGYLEDGKNVLYISMEMSERVVRSRVDVRLMQLPTPTIEALSKTEYCGRINKLKEKSRGELVIKEFGSGTAHVGHFRHVISELKLKKNFIPDILIVDYLTIMASTVLSGAAKGNTNTYFTAVAEELRALAQELGIPCWTAVQLTRSAQNSEKVGTEDVAAAIGIMATADLAIVLMQPEELVPLKQAIGKVIKNRYANKNAIGKFIIGLDNDLQCLTDVHVSSQSAVMNQDEYAQLRESVDKTTGEITNKETVKTKSLEWDY